MKLFKLLKQKTAPYFLTTGLTISTLVGCGDGTEIRDEESKIMHENAIVRDVAYCPPRHGEDSGMNPTFHTDGEGNPSIGLSPYHITVDLPAVYAVIFECKHGKFISQGTDTRHKNLWEKLKENQEVDVTYMELYKSTYRDIDNDGKKDLVERRLVKYDFLDAQPKK